MEMIGHEQIIDMRRGGLKPKSVFVHMSEPPKDYFKVEQNFPSVFVGDKKKTKEDLFFLKDISIVHLVASETTENLLSWWVALVDAQPKFLIMCFDGGVETWKQ